MAAPQMTIVLSTLSPMKQDAAKAILKNYVAQESSPKGPDGDRIDTDSMVWK